MQRPKYFMTNDARQIYGVTRQTLLGHRKRGLLLIAGRDSAGHVLYDPAELARWWQERRLHDGRVLRTGMKNRRRKAA